MQLQSEIGRFEELGVAVVAVSQEEKDLSKAPQMARQTGASFPVVHDVNRATAPQLDRTNAYFLDAKGVVRQVFPMSAYLRPSTALVLDEIERILQADAERARRAGDADESSGEEAGSGRR